MWESLKGSDFDLWLKVRIDPIAKQRGFSIVGREMRCLQVVAVEGEMVDPYGVKFPGKFWPVAVSEVFRVIPELRHLPYGQKHQDKPWLFPVEFCEVFPRPKNYLQQQVRDIFLEPPSGRK